MGIDRTTGTDADAEVVKDPKPPDHAPRPPDQPGLEPEGVPSRLESRKLAAAANEQTTEQPAENETDTSLPTDEPPSEQNPGAVEDEPESPPMPESTDSDDQDQPTDPVEPSEATDESGFAAEITEQGERDQEPAATEDRAPTDAILQDETSGPASVDQSAGRQERRERLQSERAESESRLPSDDSQGGKGPEESPPAAGEISQDPVLPIDRSQDESGSWRGKGDEYLNAEENYSVSRVFDYLKEKEPEVTDTSREAERNVPDAQLVGLEYRLKDEDRFKEKAADELAARFRDDPRGAAERIPDAIRYTYQLPADSYAEGYQNIIRHLTESGHEMVFRRNSWNNQEYKGINTRWQTSEGQLFEVQFHTPESFEAKQQTHTAYEKIRNPLTSGREVAELRAYQREVSARVPIPKGIPAVTDYRKEGY